ncbi:MAG: cAMP/cGMP-dependent 3',5'-cyclic-AMP/GMP phosphodiesterase [Spirochaetia bacterium]|nr:cAMP/cGMP-dependent 3',5'-cyclic-AMP/GMP phosphodiesterase [Spirochaetia bacterium]
MSNTKLNGAQTLPRGGYLVKTSVGQIQFGAPPETIKDTMVMPESVPEIFVLPFELFHVEKGIAVAELEFPLYFNHFICQKKTLIICTKEQKEQMEIVLQESVFGPDKVDITNEYIKKENSPGFPDIKAEMNFFRGNRQLSDLVEFGIFENNKYQIKNVAIYRKGNDGFSISDNDREIALIPGLIDYKVKFDIGARLNEPFEAPEFGITCLGPSHGFDPKDNTSGFILWINHRGIMIDPPVNSTEWLRESNVNPKLINHVILTHCHADHDAGTFQKILEESMITIHTTETIMDSFIRKYTGLTKLRKKQLYEFFNFNPIMIDSPIYIEGAEFIFHYALHAIPTIGLRAHYQNKSFFYTSDHLNHPDTLEEINKKGVFPKGRFEFLKEFPWHYDIIYHEAGIPPLHTPIKFLASLPEETKKRITVYHIAKKDFLDDGHLRLAKFGIENTLYPEIIPPKHAEAIHILDTMNNIDLFQDFPVAKAREFLGIVEEERYKRGALIIKKGAVGDKFYMIASGNILIQGIDTDYKKTYGKYEYFGEASLVTGELRSADVFAETDVILLTIKKDAFLNFIQGTSLDHYLKHLAETRKTNSWDVLTESAVFGSMTSHQKTQLETFMKHEKKETQASLFTQGKTSDKAYIMIKGTIKAVDENGNILKEYVTGDFIGDIFALRKNAPSPYSVKVIKDSEVFSVSLEDLSIFIQKNPGVYMRLIRSHDERDN